PFVRFAGRGPRGGVASGGVAAPAIWRGGLGGVVGPLLAFVPQGDYYVLRNQCVSLLVCDGVLNRRRCCVWWGRAALPSGPTRAELFNNYLTRWLWCGRAQSRSGRRFATAWWWWYWRQG